jgi:predicted kinase
MILKVSETKYTPSYADAGQNPRYKARLYILVGIPGCGKSTWAARFFKDYQIVSSDAIREEKWPEEDYVAERNQEVFDEFHARIESLLYKGIDTVADATSLQTSARQRLSDLAEKHGAETHLVFFDNEIQASKRNIKREGSAHVPQKAMAVKKKKFNQALPAILQEEEYTSVTFIGGTS